MGRAQAKDVEEGSKSHSTHAEANAAGDEGQQGLAGTRGLLEAAQARVLSAMSDKGWVDAREVEEQARLCAAQVGGGRMVGGEAASWSMKWSMLHGMIDLSVAG